jgi:hypothetical protein
MVLFNSVYYLEGRRVALDVGDETKPEIKRERKRRNKTRRQTPINNIQRKKNNSIQRRKDRRLETRISHTSARNVFILFVSTVLQVESTHLCHWSASVKTWNATVSLTQRKDTLELVTLTPLYFRDHPRSLCTPLNLGSSSSKVLQGTITNQYLDARNSSGKKETRTELGK